MTRVLSIIGLSVALTLMGVAGAHAAVGDDDGVSISVEIAPLECVDDCEPTPTPTVPGVTDPGDEELSETGGVVNAGLVAAACTLVVTGGVLVLSRIRRHRNRA